MLPTGVEGAGTERSETAAGGEGDALGRYDSSSSIGLKILAFFLGEADRERALDRTISIASALCVTRKSESELKKGPKGLGTKFTDKIFLQTAKVFTSSLFRCSQNVVVA